ncbi:unnamed protein product [Parnassius mnemosyne]|uniref:Uncharacterized protein n=1 Tax=Parnassius mnemosyne TaxID=213953 RepID=A0AAV1L6B4_9NEOP
MTNNHKNKWKCTNCLMLFKSDTNQNENSCYVTERKKYNINITTENSFEGLSDEEYSSFVTDSKLNRSCPNIGMNLEEDTQEMKNKILHLELKLKAAENEIENLHSENTALSKRLAEYERKIKTLTGICTSSSKNPTKPKNRRSLKGTQLSFREEERNSLNDESTVKLTETPSSKQKVSVRKNSEIRINSKQTRYSQLKNETMTEEQYTYAHRLYIFGDEQGRGITTQLSKLLGNKYKIYGEIKPGATTDKILEGIKLHCSTYSNMDYVLILTGKNDSDLTKMSSYLFYYLSQLKNTNIILCETEGNRQNNTEDINRIFKSYSAKLPNVNYIDLRYSYLGLPHNNLRHLCQNILQEILRLDYKYKIKNYQSKEIQKLLKGIRLPKEDIHCDSTDEIVNDDHFFR